VIRHLELPVLFDTLDRPVELLTQRLREEALNGNIELLREHDGQARIDIVLSYKLACHLSSATRSGELTILEVPSATSLLFSRSSLWVLAVAIR